MGNRPLIAMPEIWGKTWDASFKNVLIEEKDERNNTTGNAGVGKVEDGREEYEMLATYVRQACWPIPFYEREVEHIYNSSEH